MQTAEIVERLQLLVGQWEKRLRYRIEDRLLEKNSRDSYYLLVSNFQKLSSYTTSKKVRNELLNYLYSYPVLPNN